MGCVMDDEKVKYKIRDINKKEGKTQFYNDKWRGAMETTDTWYAFYTSS